MARVFLLLIRDAGLNHMFCHQSWVRFSKASQDWPAYAPVGIAGSLDNVFGRTRILNSDEYLKNFFLLFYFLLYE